MGDKIVISREDFNRMKLNEQKYYALCSEGITIDYNGKAKEKYERWLEYGYTFIVENNS